MFCLKKMHGWLNFSLTIHNLNGYNKPLVNIFVTNNFPLVLENSLFTIIILLCSIKLVYFQTFLSHITLLIKWILLFIYFNYSFFF